MGLPLFSSHSSDRPYTSAPTVAGNPNPRRFVIRKLVDQGKYTIVDVNYPDATNFEGNKILVLEGISPEEVRELDVLDPHFVEDGSVIARFAPTEQGWINAIYFVASATVRDAHT